MCEPVHCCGQVANFHYRDITWHDECQGNSHYQLLDSLLNSLFRLTTKKISNPHYWPFMWGIHHTEMEMSSGWQLWYLEGKLKHPQWWPGRSPWQPFHFRAVISRFPLQRVNHGKSISNHDVIMSHIPFKCGQFFPMEAQQIPQSSPVMVRYQDIFGQNVSKHTGQGN